LLEKFDREFEADFWAFVFLWHLGCLEYLMEIADLYPEKRALTWLSFGVVVLGAFRRLNRTKPSIED
jgi:hypothetical protein